jgi:hypothetical protein
MERGVLRPQGYYAELLKVKLISKISTLVLPPARLPKEVIMSTDAA